MDPSCSIQGNPDFYGLGIRIGIYLQWITTFLANQFLREAIDMNLETSTVFLIALFVATIVASAQNTVHVSETLVLLQLSFGFIFSILSIWGHRTRPAKGQSQIRFALAPSFLRLSLTTALSGYAVWFWFAGYNKLGKVDDGCATYTFLFFKAEANHGARVFYQIQSVLIVAAYGMLFAREFLMIISFALFVSFWTFVVSAILFIIGPIGLKFYAEQANRVQEVNDDDGSSSNATSAELEKYRKKMRGKEVVLWLVNIVRNWVHLFVAILWKEANGKESAGPHRPSITHWLIPVLDLWIFVGRTVFQFISLVLFKACPPIAFPPLIDHPLLEQIWKKSSPKEKVRKRINNVVQSKLIQYTIYAINLIAIVWSILAVELTLHWNNISDIYTINSTGQLIPLITGLVGVFTFLHEVSVEESKLRSTETLMGLLDQDAEFKDLSKEGVFDKLKDERKDLQRDEEVFPLKNGFEAVFWTRRRERRQSFSAITNDLIVADTHPTGKMPKSWFLYHLHYVGNPEFLRTRYQERFLETYHYKDKPVVFVSDFRKRNFFGFSRGINREDDYEADNTYTEHTRIANNSEHSASSRSGSSSRSTSSRGRRSGRNSDSENYNDAGIQQWRSYSLSRTPSSVRHRSTYSNPQSSTHSFESQHSSALSAFSGRSAASSSSSSISAKENRRGFARRIFMWLLKFSLRIVAFGVMALYKCIFEPLKPRLKYAATELRDRLTVYFRKSLEVMGSLSAREKEARKAESQKDAKEKRSIRPNCVHIRRNDVFGEFKPTGGLFREAMKSGSQLGLVEALAVATARLCSLFGLKEAERNMSKLPQLFMESQSIRKRKLNGEIGRTAQHEEMSNIWISVRSIWRDATTELLESIIKDRYKIDRPKGWDEEEAVQGRDAFSMYESNERLKDLRLRKINYV